MVAKSFPIMRNQKILDRRDSISQPTSAASKIPPNITASERSPRVGSLAVKYTLDQPKKRPAISPVR